MKKIEYMTIYYWLGNGMEHQNGTKDHYPFERSFRIS